MLSSGVVAACPNNSTWIQRRLDVSELGDFFGVSCNTAEQRDDFQRALVDAKADQWQKSVEIPDGTSCEIVFRHGEYLGM